MCISVLEQAWHQARHARPAGLAGTNFPKQPTLSVRNGMSESQRQAMQWTLRRLRVNHLVFSRIRGRHTRPVSLCVRALIVLRSSNRRRSAAGTACAL